MALWGYTALICFELSSVRFLFLLVILVLVLVWMFALDLTVVFLFPVLFTC